VKHPDYPKSVCEISEKDFWSSLEPPDDVEEEAAKLLEEAVKLGASRNKARAYARLAEYHRVVLADEWEHIRGEMQEGDAPDRKVLQDLLARRVRGWHNKTAQFGTRIDWNSREFGHNGFYGFHYLGWLGPAVREFVRTGSMRWRRFLIDVLTQYYEARNDLDWPIEGLHPVYYELGVSAKERIVTLTYLALIHTGEVPVDTSEALLKLLLGFGRSMMRRVKRFIVHNIHTAGTAALFRIARMFPEFEESRKWEDLALRYLHRHADESFFKDGGHKERCWGYGSHTLSRMTQIYEFAQRTGGMGSRETHYRNRLRTAYRWFAKTVGPCDLKPAFGDDHLGPAPHVFEQGKSVFPEGTDRYFGVDRSRSWRLRRSGFAVMRNGDAEESAQLTLTFGQFAGWHSHFDLLSFNFWAEGAPLIEELGRYGPYDHGLDHVFRAPESHNQVLIDDYVYDSRFDKGHDVTWHSDEKVDYFSAYHRAYRCVPAVDDRVYLLSADAVVRRTVVFVKDPGYALVLDSVQLEGDSGFNRSISSWWHSPYQFEQTGTTSARTKGSPAMLAACARQEGLKRLEIGQDYAAGEDHDADQSRWHLRMRRWMPVGYEGSLGFITLLLPFRGKMPDAYVRTVEAGGVVPWRAEALEVRTPRGRDIIVLNPERLDDMLWRGRDFKVRALVRLGNRRGEVVVK